MQQITQNKVWSVVKQLLYKHDCVIIPNFGGFVCNVEYAKIDQISHIITPASKRIVFNQNLKTNDGLLAQNLAVALQIGYSESLNLIADLVNDIQHHLEKYKQLEITTFGNFRLNAEANYVFLPDKYNTYLPASFGLHPIQANPLAEHAKTASRTRIFKDRKEIKHAKNLTEGKNFLVKTVAFATLLAVALNVYIFWGDTIFNQNNLITQTGVHTWFDSLNQSDTQTATSVPTLKEQTPPTVVAETIDSVPIILVEPILNLAEVMTTSTARRDSIHYFNFNELGEVLAEPIVDSLPLANSPLVETPTETLVEKTTRMQSVGYYVIGGVFCKEKNARKFFDQLKVKGYQPQLIINKRIKCNRVSYKKFEHLADAVTYMDSIKTTENPEAWVLTVKE